MATGWQGEQEEEGNKMAGRNGKTEPVHRFPLPARDVPSDEEWMTSSTSSRHPLRDSPRARPEAESYDILRRQEANWPKGVIPEF